MNKVMVHFAVGTAVTALVLCAVIALWCFAFWVAPMWLAIRCAAALSVVVGFLNAVSFIVDANVGER